MPKWPGIIIYRCLSGLETSIGIILDIVKIQTKLIDFALLEILSMCGTIDIQRHTYCIISCWYEMVKYVDIFVY